TVELSFVEVELRGFDLRSRERDLVFGVGVIQVHRVRVPQHREVPVMQRLFFPALPEGLRLRAGRQHGETQNRPDLLRHHAFDLPSEIVMRPPHGAIGNRRMSLHGPTNPTSIDSYPTFLMMNRSKTTSPVRALTTLSPATSTAMGSSFGPKDPMNLNVISGGLGVGVGEGGGGGSHGPRNRGSPQTGAGVGVGSCVGIGVGVGGRKSKMFRKTVLLGASRESRSLRPK